jgi:hypothetical protein
MLHGDLGSSNLAADPARTCQAQRLPFELHDPRTAKG